MAKKQIEIDARTPDAFLTASEKILKWIEEKAMIVGGLIGAALLAGIGYLGYDQWQNHHESQASSRIYEAQSVLNAKIEATRKEESDRLQKMAEDLADKKQKMPLDAPAKVDFDSSYAQAASVLEKAILADKHSNAALISAINLADFYVSHNKTDLAVNLLEQFNVRGESHVSALLLAQKATLTMDKGDFEGAIADFEKIIKNKDVDFLHSSILLKMGLCYEKLNQLERAKETYLRVSTEFGETESGHTAKGYLRLLELQSSPKG